jgi:hypothetical protein
MRKDWPTKDKDIQTARLIMEEYAHAQNSNNLGLLELVVNTPKKRIDYQLSGWVVLIAKHFHAEYGASQGDFIARQVITHCLTEGETLH